MSYASDDAQHAYLFQCGDEELFAVCLDRTGAGLPRGSCAQGWILREEFQLSVQKPVPATTVRLFAGVLAPFLMEPHTASPTIFFGTIFVVVAISAFIPRIFGRETVGQLETVTEAT
jgi:hypothetical protein